VSRALPLPIRRSKPPCSNEGKFARDLTNRFVELEKCSVGIILPGLCNIHSGCWRGSRVSCSPRTGDGDLRGGGAGSLVRTRRSCQIPDQQGKYRELLPRLGFGTEEGTRHPLQCRGFWIEFPRPLNREFLVPNRDHLSNRGICLPRSDPHHEVHQNPNRRRSS
jgi:hypothetical protein